MTHISVNLNLGTGPRTIPDDIYVQLIQSMFSKQRDVSEVRLGAFNEGRFGLSRLTILLARSFNKDQTEYIPMVVHFGPINRIKIEKNNYDRYVKNLIGNQHTPDCQISEVGDIGAIGYPLLQKNGDNSPLLTLYDTLMDVVKATANHGTIIRINESITRLFTEVLHRNNNAWYNDACLYDDQRPLWFYNQVLPPILTLEEVCPLPEPIETAPDIMSQFFYRADQDHSYELHGQTMIIGANALFSSLEIVDRAINTDNVDLCSLDVHIFDTQPVPFDPTNIRLPLTPIAARIRLQGKTNDLYHLPAQLAGITLTGIIRQSRYAFLHDQSEHHLSMLKSFQHRFDLTNPLSVYFQILSKPQSLTTSIIHGDMNLRNILLQQLKTGNQDYIPMLIDFDKTQAGGHAIFDAVKLETEYKVHILSQVLKNIDELIMLEKTLYDALTNPDSIDDPFKGNLILRDAYSFIANIRRIAFQNFQDVKKNKKSTPTEYYIGLLAYGLATLKYTNLYPNQNTSTGLSMPTITPILAISYISASFAASVVEKCRELDVSAEIFPTLCPIGKPWTSIPYLVGRDEVIATALKQLRSDCPITVIYGRSGSGCKTVVEAICARMQRYGYEIIPEFWKNNHSRTLDGWLSKLQSGLTEHGINPSLLQIDLPTSHLDASSRKKAAEMAMYRLVAFLENHHQLFLLVIHLNHDEQELLKQISTLSGQLKRTALIVLTDYPIALNAQGFTQELPLLTDKDIAAYLKYKQIIPDEPLVRHLLDLSQGLAGLLAGLVNHMNRSSNEVFNIQSLHGYRFLNDFLTEQIDDLDPDIRMLVDIGALLSTYGDYTENDLHNFIHRYNLPTIDKVLEVFHHQFGNHDGLTKRLYKIVLDKLRPKPTYIEYCRELAAYYCREDNLFLQAQYLNLARDWRKTCELLLLFLKYPEKLFKSGCGQVYNLIQNVLTQNTNEYTLQLHDLAATCTIFMGRYKDAIVHLDAARDTTPINSPLYQQLSIRLMMVATLLDDNIRLQDETNTVLQRELTTPFAGIALGYRGITKVGDDNIVAHSDITKGLQLLKNKEHWPKENSLLYTAVWFHIREAEAQVLYMQGNYTEAINILDSLYIEAQQPPIDRHLIAKLDSVIGICYSYRGKKGDHTLAVQHINHAIKFRRELGDYGGLFHSLQNVAILTTDIAKTANDWNQASKYYDELIDVVKLIQHEDPMRPLVNQIDLAIRKGDFLQAHTLIDHIKTGSIAISNSGTQVLFYCNQIKLALEEGDINTFRTVMDSLESLLLETADPDTNQQYEWLQLSVEGQLRLDEPIGKNAWLVFEECVANRETNTSLDDAWAALVHGLWMLSEGNWLHALKELAVSSQLWLDVDYIYLGTWPLVWMARIQQKINDPAATQTITRIRQFLQPFGSNIPLLRLLEQPLIIQRESIKE